MRSFQHFHPDAFLTALNEAHLPGRRIREIQSSLPREGSVVVDPDVDAASIPNIGYAEPCTERERAMRSRQALRIEALATRRKIQPAHPRSNSRRLAAAHYQLLLASQEPHLSIGVKLLFRLLTRGKVQVQGRVPFPTRNSPRLRVAPPDMLIHIC